MTSQISLYKLLCQDLRRRGWVAVIIFVVALLLFPLLGMIELENKISWMQEISSAFNWEDLLKWYREFCGPLNQVGIIFVIAAAVLLGVTGFTYLHSREKLDFYHSFPVRREKYFAGIYLSGVLMFVVPYVLSYILLLLLGAANHMQIKNAAAWCLQTVGWNIFFFLLLYGVTILAMLITGKTTIGICGAGILMLYGSLVYNTLEELHSFFYKSYLGGVSGADAYSPYAFYTNTITKLAGEGHVSAGTTVTALLLLLMVTAACIGCCRIRPTEAAENAIAFPKTEAVIQVAITIPMSITIGMFAAGQSVNPEKWFLIASLISAVLLTLTIGFIYHMDFRRILHQKAVLLVSLLLMAGIFVFFKYDLIGYDSYFPKKGEISQIAIRAENCLNYIHGVKDYTERDILDRLEIPMTNEIYDKLEELVKEQTISGVSRKDLPYENAFTIMFRMDTGKRVYRVYYAEREQQLQLLKLFLADPVYSREAFRIKEVLQSKIESVALSDIRKQYRVIKMSNEQRKKLLEVYQSELMSCDILSLRGTYAIANLEVECYEDVEDGRTYQSVSLPVYEQFTGTQALLEEYGYTIQREIPLAEIQDVRIEDNRRMDIGVAEALVESSTDVTVISDQEEIKELLPYLRCMNLQGLWFDEDSLEVSIYLQINWEDGSMINYIVRKGSGILELLESEENE